MEFHTIMDPFQETIFPLGEYVASGLEWIVLHFRWIFQAMKEPIQLVLNSLEHGLRALPPMTVIAFFWLLGWQVAGLRIGLLAIFCLVCIGMIGAWPHAMTTLAIIMTAVIFCVLIGVPLGILAARSDRFDFVLRPVLDFMQTIPSFVYLVPIVMLFGIGNVPGVIVTIIYAIAPVIRLSNLGIRQVRADLVEAAFAFGASPNQTLFKIQIPQALPTIMAGVNQTIMMSLAMSVVASMISVTGLGQMVLRGIGRLDMEIATTGGVGIVLVAIMIDRISQGFGLQRRDRGHRHWYQTGPAGLILSAAEYLKRPAKSAAK